MIFKTEKARATEQRNMKGNNDKAIKRLNHSDAFLYVTPLLHTEDIRDLGREDGNFVSEKKLRSLR